MILKFQWRHSPHTIRLEQAGKTFSSANTGLRRIRQLAMELEDGRHSAGANRRALISSVDRLLNLEGWSIEDSIKVGSSEAVNLVFLEGHCLLFHLIVNPLYPFTSAPGCLSA